MSSINDLKDALDIGLGVVTRIWEYKTKDWVRSVFAADIDNDGEVEVITCSRDGRVHLLSAKSGDWRWERVVGEKVWFGTGAVGFFPSERITSTAHIIVGTRDGKVFVLTENGNTITKEGYSLPFRSDGKAIDLNAEMNASWLNTGSQIRQVYINPEKPSTIIVGSEDRCAYGLDSTTGQRLWKFPTDGWVRAVFSADLDGDGDDEILVGSVDRHLYILDSQGQQLTKIFYISHYTQSVLPILTQMAASRY